MTDITQVLSAVERGDDGAVEELFPLVYGELRKLAARKMSRENPGQTLQTTALVHEVYLRLAGERRAEPWAGRRQFFAAAAEAMRRILVENARRRKCVKHGGGLDRRDFQQDQIETNRPSEEILALHDALDDLAQDDALKAELVKLRYFVGLTIPEAADVLGISSSSVDRHWAYARAWLHQQITKGDTTG